MTLTLKCTNKKEIASNTTMCILRAQHETELNAYRESKADRIYLNVVSC